MKDFNQLLMILILFLYLILGVFTACDSKEIDKAIVESTPIISYVSGTDYEIAKYSNRTCAIRKYRGDEVFLDIPQTLDGYLVTSIEDNAFSECRSLAIVTLPEDVTSIGDQAFSYCTSLAYINIPSRVTSIGAEAFHNCDSLDRITIPASVNSIGDGAFESCGALENIIVDVENPNYADIRGVLFDKNAKIIHTFPAGKNSSVYTIPEGIQAIGKKAFSACKDLRQVNIPDSVTKIGESAFYWCESLTSITIPASVCIIGARAFSSCSSLENITVDADNSIFGIFDGVLYNKKDKILHTYPSTKKSVIFIIPEGTISIEERAFDNCKTIEKIIVPEGLISIGDEAFLGCNNLSNIEIPDSVTSIGASAFRWCNLTGDITIPDSVISIGEDAFFSCDAMNSITIPSSVRFIGEAAFFGCGSLASINVDLNNPTYSDIEGVLFNNATKVLHSYPGGKKGTSYSIPEETLSIAQNAFDSEYLQNIVIPEGVTTIGDRAFAGCDSLMSITFPVSITAIGGEPLFWSKLEEIKVKEESYSDEYFKKTKYAPLLSYQVTWL